MVAWEKVQWPLELGGLDGSWVVALVKWHLKLLRLSRRNKVRESRLAEVQYRSKLATRHPKLIVYDWAIHLQICIAGFLQQLDDLRALETYLKVMDSRLV